MKEVVLKQQEVESRETLRITGKKKWRHFTFFKGETNVRKTEQVTRKAKKASVMLLRRW